MGIRAHLLPLGDEAGPAPAPYALHGVDLTLDPAKRPSGWVDSLDFGSFTGAGLRSPLTMWLIEGADLNIVVDTGCDVSASSTARRSNVLEAHAIWTDHKPEWTVDAQLARFGLTPDDIDVVINTCCHFDHIGHNTLFRNAQFVVQRREFALAIHPPEWALYYYREFAYNLLDVRDRLKLIDGDLLITAGVSVHLLGGHSPGTQVVLLETDAGRVCIPGDLAPFYKNIELSWPMGAFFDLEGVVRAYDWMRSNADIIVPHHDWGFFDRYPHGSVGGPEDVAAAPAASAHD